MRASHYDVLIAGGGLVGTTLALALGNDESLRIGLAESHLIDADSKNFHYDDRSVALAYGTRLILEQLGIWSLIAKDCESISDIHISERGRFGATRLNAREERVSALGYVVENHVLGNALLGELARRSNVQLLGGCSVVAFEQGEDAASVSLECNGKSSQLQARLLVAADGAHSRLRSMAGVDSRVRDYEQVAIIANVTAEDGHNGVAYERFTDTGPLALLPLRGGRCSMVMTVKSKQLEDIISLDDRGFTALLQRRFGQRLGRFTRVGKRSHFPLSLIAAKSHAAGRMLLIGNARHNLHPVSGQGFNLAMRDLAVLAELVLSGRFDDPAAPELLAELEARRRGDHRVMETYTDILARLFTQPFKPLAYLRSAGLIATDLLPFVRHALARQSMGLRSRLPRISSTTVSS
jgi:2-octaprenyl-6-methoxyphenol hydroxylase